MGAFLGSAAAWLVMGVVAFGLYGCPQYNVYSSKMDGEAELAQSNYSKQTKVQEALAERDASKLLAEKRVIDAQGIEQANKIVAEQLGGPDNYLRFEYIQMLKDAQSKQVIYLPTEAGMPILEHERNSK